MDQDQFIKARCVLPIYYSTVSNTSKHISYELQNILQEQKYIVPVCNIGDIDLKQLQQQQSTVIFVVATYGNGNSPPDGQQFVQWLQLKNKQLKQSENDPKNLLQNLSFAIMALGNRSFEHFCANGLTIQQNLLKLGAKQVCQICCCDSHNEEETAQKKIDAWSKKLIQYTNKQYEVKSIHKTKLLQNYTIDITNNPIPNWKEEIKKQEYRHKIGQEFLIFNSLVEAEVVHIKELRKSTQNGRSTMWIRMKKPQGIAIQPAYNLSVFPENIRNNIEEEFKQNITVQSTKENGKIPIPSMSLQQLWKFTNFSQKADINILKKALSYSNQTTKIKQSFDQYKKNIHLFEQKPIRCSELCEKLKPSYQFFIELGLNTLRPYTLSSWHDEYIDLTVSYDPLGLTSKYFKSIPKTIRISPVSSQFYIPTNRPLVMIANGSGIAPFRSITQYLAPRLEQNKVELYLYFGIQNKEVDYFYQEEWQSLQREGKIRVKVAESRADPDNKVYVQQLIKEDRQFMRQHLFEKRGVIFICGSDGMAKAVNSQIYQAVKLQQKIPFKAFKKYKAMYKDKTIIQEVFE